MKKDYRQELESIKYKLAIGVITYDEAKVVSKPIIDEMNQIAQKIAKQFGKKAHKFNFASLMR